MLALLSPAKKMNFETPDTNLSGGEPLFHKEAYQLAKQLNDFSFQKLKTLLTMHPNYPAVPTTSFWKIKMAIVFSNW